MKNISPDLWTISPGHDIMIVEKCGQTCYYFHNLLAVVIPGSIHVLKRQYEAE